MRQARNEKKNRARGVQGVCLVCVCVCVPGVCVCLVCVCVCLFVCVTEAIDSFFLLHNRYECCRFSPLSSYAIVNKGPEFLKKGN